MNYVVLNADTIKIHQILEFHHLEPEHKDFPFW